jgi:HlyD family secretion protein
VAEGKLVPAGYLKIVQPSEQGVIKEIFVREGELVREGQVLMRMDTALLAADGRALSAEYHTKRLALRRIEAQLAARPLARDAEDPPGLFAQTEAQYAANSPRTRTRSRKRETSRPRARPRRRQGARQAARCCRTTASRRRRSRSSPGQLAGRLMYRQTAREDRRAGPQDPGIHHRAAGDDPQSKRLAQINADTGSLRPSAPRRAAGGRCARSSQSSATATSCSSCARRRRAR